MNGNSRWVKKMSESEFQKCSCQKCGGHIEFPSRGLGLTIDCPHCGDKTTLCRLAPAVYPAPATTNPPPPPPVPPAPPVAPPVAPAAPAAPLTRTGPVAPA